ncbi:MAG: hypothetical protein CMJ70_09030 [Planctomycetaceae bacterium]|nr:hypothetical protein [Planctomycetaceae bacterium]HAA69812.1 hypothetical protein [Planctomycetaceae bacterium]
MPHVGSAQMPPWNRNELPDPPVFRWQNIATMLGPGLFMAGAAIGGGEWLTGPVITARYGGSLLWLATLSILGQCVYNVEVSRYTLYTGEPIFAGKFRTLPGPRFWLVIYLLFDVYMFFPFLAAAGAPPLVAMVRGEIPNPAANPDDEFLVRSVSIGIFLLAMVPLIIGGKIYNSIKVLMAAKITLVMGFLIILACLFSTRQDWIEIGSGFFKFGTVPVRTTEDVNGNGILDAGEDWDGDQRLDVAEPSLALVFDTDDDGQDDASDVNGDGQPDRMVSVQQNGNTIRWPDLDGDSLADTVLPCDTTGDGTPDQEIPLDRNGDGKLDRFVDIDGDGIRDGGNVANVLVALLTGRQLPVMDMTIIGFLCALVAISGNGGLGNSAISNYTREQGWGMGAHVGAIPSIIGGRHLQLSHVGTVFEPTAESLVRWRRWFWHVARDQWAVWMPGCFVGVGLPAMMSVMFLPRGFFVDDTWQTALFTANGLRENIGAQWGNFFWMASLFCAFIVLATGVTPGADGFLRRWVDVIWIASPRARRLDPKSIRYVYFGVLATYAAFGVIMLTLEEPTTLLFISALLSNFALGFTCLHTLAVNLILLPKELRPGWFCRIALFLAGLFFLLVATIFSWTRLQASGYL